MYIKNKLGIYVYSNRITNINNVRFTKNSINHVRSGSFRIIKFKLYGINLHIKKYV